ncbi:hypothetical protein EMIHUDRAFT_208296 [Emiliania huxleyi CCMP1516]|uniref:Dynein axonemal light chain 4 n=2 Tax=Emiliania huxleyi TaxID=2903 RepID=A0A0D3JAB2_EMIH1|nr:hypothetical protein EMIHUDRAFT_208296 [Emiliania huxleyi CCMP1516]EOD20447.1 hypothetical protein EMIHUDRAFT_208296 [Emiliania huxleyi CCMP1516]|eukprot:XP_005772876.1 hypothetical protein EMIHUDRAFT_208296 [Emiliania huxleyi CCMP1516]
MADKGEVISDKEAYENLRKSMNYALVRNCDMNDEMRQDSVDIVITACEKFQGDYEAAARLVKETMDKKYNESWVVVIGEGFTFEVKHVLWMFLNQTAVLCYKAGARQAGA